MLSSRGSSQLRDQTQVSCIVGVLTRVNHYLLRVRQSAKCWESEVKTSATFLSVRRHEKNQWVIVESG